MPCLQKALCMKQRQQLLLYSSKVELKQQEKLCQVTIINNGLVYYNYVPLLILEMLMSLCKNMEAVRKVLDHDHIIEMTEVETADQIPDTIIDGDVVNVRQHFSRTAWKTVLQIRKRVYYFIM